MSGDDALLVEVTRGGVVESRHFGSAAIADATGLRWTAGAPEACVFPRSALKPIQALQLIESGAAARFAVKEAEIALACGSHNGEDMHVNVVRAWIERLGLDAGALACGAHWPTLDEATRQLAIQHETPSALHNNCSGKHAGFISTALHLQEDISGYESYGHPVQARWMDTLGELSDTELRRYPHGVDGCSIPSQSLPLTGLALAYARFADGRGVAALRRSAMRRIEEAMRMHPYLVAGKGRACTRIISATQGRVLVKMGAEGVFVGWIPEAGVGFSLKIIDGASRAADVAVVVLIAQALGPGHELAACLREMARTELNSCKGAYVGEIRVASTD